MFLLISCYYHAKSRHTSGRCPSMQRLPAAVIRFHHCIGVEVMIFDPHYPQQNGFVKRHHRANQEVCLSQHRHPTFEQIREVTDAFLIHYNWHCLLYGIL